MAIVLSFFDMVRRLRRSTRGRGRGNRVRRNILNIPRMLLSNRGTFRTSAGQSIQTVKSIFGLSGAPANPNSKSGSWWFTSLKIAGWFIFKLLTTALSTEGLALHADLHGRKDLTAVSTITGCIQMVYFGATDIIANSPFATTTTDPNTKTVNYNQCRLMGVKVRVTPGMQASKRSGMYAVAIIPLTEGDMDQPQTTITSFHDVMKLPNAVMDSTSRPMTVHYSPKVSEPAYQWSEIRYGHDDFVGKVAIGFMDYAANTQATVANEYDPVDAMFHVCFEGSAQVREPTSDPRHIRSMPKPRMNASSITVNDVPTPYEVPLSDVVYHKGLLYHDIPPSLVATPDSFESLG